MENLGLKEYLRNTFSEKKVFITGHTGFKGAWLCFILQHFGAIIKGYSLPPIENNSLFNYIPSDFNLQTVYGDIRDKEKLKQEIVKFKPDFIFHLAAQPLVLQSYQQPAETFEVNVIGTANLLEAIINFPSKLDVVVVTTDKVYENNDRGQLFVETDRLGGYDPYSASKACTELSVSSFRNSFFNPAFYNKHLISLSSARAGNVIGGGDWNKNRIIPDIVHSLKSKKSIKVRNPGSVRPWQHVLDPLTGYLMMAANQSSSKGNYIDSFNFGPDKKEHLQVKEIVELAISFWGSGSWEDCSSKENLHEAEVLKLDTSLAEKKLGWVSKLSAKVAVEWTLGWYLADKENQINIVETQIRNYFVR